MTVENPRENAGGSGWVVGLAVLCLVVFGYAYRSENATPSIAFLAGEYLVYAVVVWLVFHLIFLRKRSGKASFGAFAAIYAAMLGGGAVSAEKQAQQAVQAMSAIQREINRITEASVDASGLPTRIEQTPHTPLASGEFGEMERFMKEFIDRMVTQRNDYLTELEAINWDSILNAQRLGNDVAMSESKVIIAQAKAIVDKYEKKTTALMQQTRGHIGSLNLSEYSKQRMLAGFEKGMSKSGNKIDEQWRLEREIVQQFEHIIVMLASSRDWEVTGDQILFYSDDELALFNNHLQSIHDLTQQQEALQRSGLAETNRSFDLLKNAVQR